MNISEEIYDILKDFISNYEVLLTKNFFAGEFQPAIQNFENELFKLCQLN